MPFHNNTSHPSQTKKAGVAILISRSFPGVVGAQVLEIKGRLLALSL